MKIENSIEIKAPVADVWDLTVDVEAWPEHTPTMTSVERLDSGPLEVGSQALVKQPGQRAKVWTVTALDPGHRFAWSTKAMGVDMTGAHVLDATESGTTNTLTIEMEGRLSSLVGSLFGRPIAKAIAQENKGFKTAAER
jgi:uncharacterized membrane protein